MQKISLMKMVVYILIVFLMSGCAGTKAVVNEAWKVTKIVSSGEPDQNTSTFDVEVRNCCGLPEVKSASCSAGTSSSLDISIGASYGVPGTVSIDPSVGASLGFNQEGGMEMALEPPPPGYVYLYTIEKTYIIETGLAEVVPSKGEKEEAEYRFTARCSLKAEDRQRFPWCEETCPLEPESLPTPDVVPTFTTMPTLTISPPKIANLVFCSEECDGKNSTKEYPDGAKKFLSIGNIRTFLTGQGTNGFGRWMERNGLGMIAHGETN
jgi:hypothetical protein